MAARRIGTYEVEGLLGEGGIGQVFAARDMVLGRRVAIKLLRPELAHNRDFIERFHVEAKSLGNLAHPNITTIYAFLTDLPDAPMVMELVDGETLGAILAREHRLDLRYATAVLAQTIAGLGYAHRVGVVHRDIKPANLMVTRDGLVKIMDFGIAKIQGSNLTRTGMFQGTLSYASPEQIRGEAVGVQSDQYSLGVVLYQMLTGEAPFIADSEYGLMTAHLRDQPPPLPDWVPQATHDAVMRALAKRPEDRFASIEEFGRAAGSAAVRGEAIDILQHGLNAAPVAEAEEPTRIIRRGSAHRRELPPADPAAAAAIAPTGPPSREDDPAWPIAAIGHNEPSVSVTAGHSAQLQRLTEGEGRRVALTLPPRRRTRPWLLAIGAAAAAGIVASVGGLMLHSPPQVSETAANASAPPPAPAPSSSGSAAADPGPPPELKSTLPVDATSKVAAAEPGPAASAPEPPPASAPPSEAAVPPPPPPVEAAGAPPQPAAVSPSPAPQQAEVAPAINPPAPPSSEATPPEAPKPADQTAMIVPPVQEGDDSTWTDERRREVQTELMTMDNLQSGADGDFGPATRTAIKQFQSFLGDPETGVMTAAERQTLHDMVQRLSALLTRGDASPDGVAAASVRGASARHQRAQAAMRGSNGAPDPAEALYWDGLAASDGEAGAATDLGTMLVRGQGVPKPDPQGAMLMWWAAAARGEPIAMFNLGALWELGRGAGPDLDKAKAWYRRAAAHNHAAARAALKRLGA